MAVEWTPAIPREICEWDVSALPVVLRRCYWPHRAYDLLTASIMVDGLVRSATALGGAQVEVRLDDDGRIWFSGAPAWTTLRSIALDPVSAWPLLRRQIDVYERILQQLPASPQPGGRRLAHLAGLLTDYFSAHLLLHDTYESVFHDTRGALAAVWGEETALECMNVLLAPPIVEWQLHADVVSRKDVFVNDKALAPPRTGPHRQVIRHMRGVEEWLAHRRLSPGAEVRRAVRYAAAVEVTKEWKFVMNKLLFSRLGETVSLLAGKAGRSLQEVRLMSWRELASLADAVMP